MACPASVTAITQSLCEQLIVWKYITFGEKQSESVSTVRRRFLKERKGDGGESLFVWVMHGQYG